MSFWSDHGDALIAAAAGLVGVLTAVPLEWARRRHDDRNQAQTWRRDHQREAFVPFLTAGRDLHRAWERAYETRRTNAAAEAPAHYTPKAYEPDEAVEAAFTSFISCFDIARLLPSVGSSFDQTAEHYEQAARDLVDSCRSNLFLKDAARGYRRELFLDASKRMQEAVRAELAL